MAPGAPLATPRLEIRPWAPDEAEAFHDIWGDPEVIFWGAAKDLAASRAAMERVTARCAGQPWPIAWHAVVERSSGSIVGDVLLQPAPYAPGDLEAGWHFRRDAWGRGYATEAARALIDEAFARLPVERLTCVIMPSNQRSQRVAARVGFTRVGPIVHANLPHDLLEVRRPK
jgi:RimJ/RimL family protein N-acetyltransferase